MAELLKTIADLLFLYLLLGLINLMIVEVIEAVINFRAITLEKAIRNLFLNSQLYTRFYQHPLIAALYLGRFRTKGQNLPSYIPAHLFSYALIDILLEDAKLEEVSMENLVKATKAQPQSLLNATLGALTREAGNNLQKARKNIELWFNSAMDGASGRYKRHVFIKLIVTGFIISSIINADTIAFVQQVHTTQNMRDVIVATTEEFGKEYVKKTFDLDSTYNKIRKLDEISKYDIPIGWNNHRLMPHTIMDWNSKIIGWLITGGIAALVATFLFDWLNRFMMLRSTVKPIE